MNAQGGTPLYRLAAAPLALKWAVTLFLATIGVAYVFGVLMVTLWVGMTPGQVASTYRPHVEMANPARERSVTEKPIDLEQALGGEREQHTIDTRLLVQDTHVHVPVYALIAATLSLVALGLRWPRRWDALVIFALFAGPILDFSGMWLTKLVAGGFAYFTLIGGWTMAASYATVAGVAIWQLWIEGSQEVRP